MLIYSPWGEVRRVKQIYVKNSISAGMSTVTRTCDETLALGESPHQAHHPHLFVKITSETFQERDSLQNLWPVLKIVKAVNTKEGLGNCRSPEESKET